MTTRDESEVFVHAPAMRRSGKSTTISMLAAMARGERELFEGMDVNAEDSPFCIGEQKFSVIQLNFSGGLAEKWMSITDLQRAFVHELVLAAKIQHGLDISGIDSLGQTLSMWLHELRRKEHSRPVVMLIDEYDNPVTTFLPQSPAKAREVAELLSPFYSAIKKAQDVGGVFHKVFVTGVSKFSMMSMFSDANQFTPIMERTAAYSNLYGFTQSEIRNTYGAHIEKVFDGRPVEDVIAQMKSRYNGYCFHPEQEDLVYNPWSVVNCLRAGALEDFWFETATSSTIVNMLGLHGINDVMNGFNITKKTLFAPISAQEHPSHWRQIAFQSGYATIKKAVPLAEDEFGRNYNMFLGPPNQEVRNGLTSGIVEFLVGKVPSNLKIDYGRKLQELDFRGAKETLCAIVQSLSSHLLPRNETQFSSYAIHSLLEVDGFYAVYADVGVKLEGESGPGRPPSADGALLFEREGKMNLVVVELKYGKSLEIARQQILRNKYVERVLKWVQEQSNVVVDSSCIYIMSASLRKTVAHQEPEVQLKSQRFDSEKILQY